MQSGFFSCHCSSLYAQKYKYDLVLKLHLLLLLLLSVLETVVLHIFVEKSAIFCQYSLYVEKEQHSLLKKYKNC